MMKNRRIPLISLLFSLVIVCCLFVFCACSSSDSAPSSDVYTCEIVEDGTAAEYSLAFVGSEAVLTRSTASSFRVFTGSIFFKDNGRYILQINAAKDGKSIPSFLSNSEIFIDGSTFTFSNPPTSSSTGSGTSADDYRDPTVPVNPSTGPSESPKPVTPSPETPVSPEEPDPVITDCAHENLVTLNAKAPTCTESGQSGVVHCAFCGKFIKESAPIPALGHTSPVVSKPAVAPTCTDIGYTEETSCSRCGLIFEAQSEIPSLGHTPITTAEAQAPSCTEEGRTAEISCSVCNSVINESESVPATGHSHVKRVCSTCGDIDYIGSFAGEHSSQTVGSDSENITTEKDYILVLSPDGSAALTETVRTEKNSEATMSLDGETVILETVSFTEPVSSPTAEEYGFTRIDGFIGTDKTVTYTRTLNGTTETYYFIIESDLQVTVGGRYVYSSTESAKTDLTYEFKKDLLIAVTDAGSYRLNLANDTFEHYVTPVTAIYYVNGTERFRHDFIPSENVDIRSVLSDDLSALSWNISDEDAAILNGSAVIGAPSVAINAYVEYSDTFTVEGYSANITVPHGDYSAHGYTLTYIFETLLSSSSVSVENPTRREIQLLFAGEAFDFTPPESEYALTSDRQFTFVIRPLNGYACVKVSDTSSGVTHLFFADATSLAACETVADVVALLDTDDNTYYEYSYDTSLTELTRTPLSISVIYVTPTDTYNDVLTSNSYSIKSYDGITEWYAKGEPYTAYSENQVVSFSSEVTLYHSYYTVTTYDGEEFVSSSYFGTPELSAEDMDGFVFLGFFVNGSLFSGNEVGIVDIDAVYQKTKKTSPTLNSDGEILTTLVSASGTDTQTKSIPALSNECYAVSTVTPPTLLTEGTQRYYHSEHGEYFLTTPSVSSSSFNYGGKDYVVTLGEDGNATISCDGTTYDVTYESGENLTIVFRTKSSDELTLKYAATLNAAGVFISAETDDSGYSPAALPSDKNGTYYIYSETDYYMFTDGNCYYLADSDIAIFEYGGTPDSSPVLDDGLYTQSAENTLYMCYKDGNLYVGASSEQINASSDVLDFEYDTITKVYLASNDYFTVNGETCVYRISGLDRNYTAKYDNATSKILLYEASEGAETITFVYSVDSANGNAQSVTEE